MSSQPLPESVDTIVIGAGIAGLVAAHELAARGSSTLVLEAGDHVGGRIQTLHEPYGRLENGGIFHTQQYPRLRALLRDLGLADRIVTVPTGFNSRVLTDAGWKSVDYGSLLGPVLFGGISLRDKAVLAKAAAAVLTKRPRSEDLGDLTSMLGFDDRSSTDVATQRTADFFTSGPHEFLWGVESKDISFAMLALQLHVFKGELREIGGGTGQLTDALAAGLDVRLGTPVAWVEDVGTGVSVHLADGRTIAATSAVIATPADVAADLWKDAPAAVRAHLEGIRYSRIDYAYLRTAHRVELRHENRPLSMEVIPTRSRDGRTIGGIYQCNDWVHDGGLLLVTAANGADAASIEDDGLLDRLHREAVVLHPELDGAVLDRRLIRHERYTPTFPAGSVSRLAAARRVLPAGRITLAGDHMAAPWVEGAVLSGQLAAEQLSRRG